jgi:hypothetical protein
MGTSLKLLPLGSGFFAYFMPFRLATGRTAEPLPGLSDGFVAHPTCVPKVLFVSTRTFDQPLSGARLDGGKGSRWKNKPEKLMFSGHGLDSLLRLPGTARRPTEKNQRSDGVSHSGPDHEIAHGSDDSGPHLEASPRPKRPRHPSYLRRPQHPTPAQRRANPPYYGGHPQWWLLYSYYKNTAGVRCLWFYRNRLHFNQQTRKS